MDKLFHSAGSKSVIKSTIRDGLKRQIEGYGVCLKEVTLQDMDMVRHWRNDPYIKQFMISSDTITSDHQLAWFESVNTKKNQQHFVIYYKTEAIGMINIKALDNELLTCASQIEPGLYVYDERYRGNFLAFCPALLINDYCFEYLSCELLVARVLPDNCAAIKFNVALGYKELVNEEIVNEGMARNLGDPLSLVKMSLTRNDYGIAHKKIKRFIR